MIPSGVHPTRFQAIKCQIPSDSCANDLDPLVFLCKRSTLFLFLVANPNDVLVVNSWEGGSFVVVYIHEFLFKKVTKD